MIIRVETVIIVWRNHTHTYIHNTYNMLYLFCSYARLNDSSSGGIPSARNYGTTVHVPL